VPHPYAKLLASSRRNNEDRAEVFEHGDVLVVVVADGVGGMGGGAAASDAVLVAVRAALSKPAFDVRAATSWANVLEGVDMQLAKTMVGETTAVIVVVGPDGLVGASAGDSEAWVISNVDVDDLTADPNRKKRIGRPPRLPPDVTSGASSLASRSPTSLPCRHDDPQLRKLAGLDPRTGWTREAQDLTPWFPESRARWTAGPGREPLEGRLGWNR
jgi:hypothetical protein